MKFKEKDTMFESMYNEKQRSLGFIRQYLAELPDDKMVSAKELWKIFCTFQPLMTEEQEKKLVEVLKSVYEKS